MGVNFTLWSIVGAIKFIHHYLFRNRFAQSFSYEKEYLGFQLNSTLTPHDVAAIVPAHNEERVIAKTIESLLQLLSRDNIYVISDGSKDKTAAIARGYDVNVLELPFANGKAGALEIGIRRFNISEKFQAVLFVDADTLLSSNYLTHALPYFADKGVVAVAGYARTRWNPERLSLWKMFFIVHRERVYFLMQAFIKYGQTWAKTNVTPIIPGFASIYRASILPQITMNPPGLVIEDFNMTFEVHHKKLGKIVLDPKISGYTQDPDNFHDYFKQIKRWNLGFWQTVRRHGIWPSMFWAALLLFLAEAVVSAIGILLLPLLLLIWVLPLLTGGAIFDWQFFSSLHTFLTSYASLQEVFLTLFLADYLLTTLTATVQNRPQFFLYGAVALVMRFIDSVSLLYTLPKAFVTSSTGKWVSPARR